MEMSIGASSDYIFAIVYSVHKIEINGLVGVWRVVSGRRKNILKGEWKVDKYLRFD